MATGFFYVATTQAIKYWHYLFCFYHILVTFYSSGRQ